VTTEATSQTGPYTLTTRLGHGKLGGVFLAVDKTGRHAIVARLSSSAPDADRKRFAEAVRELAVGETDGAGVLGAEPKVTRPWVATALGNPTGADKLFADFDPSLRLRGHVPASEADLTPPHPFSQFPPSRSGIGALVPILIAIGVVLALCLGLGTAGAVLVSRPTPQQNGHGWDGGMDHPMPSAPTPSSSPTPPSKVSPAPEPPTKGSWPASWKKFGKTDKTYTMKLAGVPFSFRVPASWGCLLLSSDANTTVVSCIEDSYPNDQRPRVRLTFRACPNSCSATQQRQQRADIETFGQRWIAPDTQSTYAEAKSVSTSIGDGRYVVAISRFFHSKSGGSLDRQLIITGSGGKDRVDQVQQTLNDIRVRVS
jgi:hypothetical protein